MNGKEGGVGCLLSQVEIYRIVKPQQKVNVSKHELNEL